MLIPVFGIIFGTTMIMFVFAKIIGLIKFSIESRQKNKSGEGSVSKIEFNAVRSSLERRIQTLESIVIDENNSDTIQFPEESEEDSGGRLKNKLKSG